MHSLTGPDDAAVLIFLDPAAKQNGATRTRLGAKPDPPPRSSLGILTGHRTWQKLTLMKILEALDDVLHLALLTKQIRR